MKMKILIAAIAMMTIAAKPVTVQDHVSELEQYVKWYFKKFDRKARERAVNEFVPLVVTYSNEYKIDPLLIATIITHESGWRHHVTGKIGEIGLMQVHGAATKEARRRKIPISTPQGQLIAGISWMKKCLKRCENDLIEALGMYQTGRCKSIAGARMRARRYEAAKKMLRETQ